MASLKIEYEIVDHNKVDIVDDFFIDFGSLYTAIQGNLWISLGEDRRFFEDTMLVQFSEGLIDAAWIVLSFGQEGERRSAIIPDYSPVVSLRMENNGVLVSIADGGQDLSAASCDVAEFIREVGSFHKSITECLLSENPHLLELQFFQFIYPGANYFLEKEYKRSPGTRPGRIRL